MSAHASVRTFICAAAVVWLFAGSHAAAQAPPAPDAEQRLKALENKMDRVLKLVEANAASKPASQAAAIQAARDKVSADLKAKEEERLEFLQMFRPTIGAGKNVVAERLAKYEGRRSELKIKMQEMNDQLARIEKAYKDGGNKSALEIIRALGRNIRLDEHPAEVIIERLNRQREKLVAALSEKHANVADVDEAIGLIRKIYGGRDGSDARDYIAVMKEELTDVDTRIQTLTNMIDKEVRDAREMNKFEVRAVQLREETEALRNALKVLDSLLAGDAPQKPK